jgi:hypothetical protein
MDRDLTLQLLLDRQEITDTLYRYGSSIDDKNRAGLRRVFTDDATARFGGREWLTGGDQIVDWIFERSKDRGWAHHHLSVFQVDVEGDTARSLTYLTAHDTAADAPGTVWVTIGRYHDELRRTDAGWRIARRDMEVGWRESRDARSPGG